MKRMSAMVLSLVIVLSCVFAIPASAEAKYGLDNYLDTSKDLVVAYLGGSITEGAGSSPNSNRYATLVTNEFFQASRTDGAKVTEINGGVGGTGAAFGLQRINKDITYAKPDIVFVEFAVNDSGTAEASLKNSIENIVRQLQSLPKIPEIIFLYTTCLAHDNVTRAASYMSQVAKAYNIPEIDLNTFIWDGVEKGIYVWDKTDKENTLTGDNTHPNNKGYRVYADRMKEVMSEEGFFKKNNVLENPLFYTSVTEHPVCVDTNSGNVSTDRIVRANFKTASEAGLSSGYTFSDAAAKLTNDNMLITDGDWTDTTKVSDGTYSSDVSKHMDILSVSNTAGSKMYYRFTGTAFGIFGANGPKGGILATNIYKASDLSKVYKSANIGRYQNITYYKPDGGYYFSGLPYDTYIVEMTTAASSNGGTTYGIGYFLVDDGKPSVKPQALNPEIVGDAVIGEKLTASFTYKGNSISEGTPKYEWLQSDSFSGEYSVISTDKEYTVTESDADKYLKCKITPVNSYDVEGTAVYTKIVKISAKTMSIISKYGDFEGDTSFFVGVTKEQSKGMSGTAAALANGTLKTTALPLRTGYTYHYSAFVKPEADITASIKVNSSVSETVSAKAGVWTKISFTDNVTSNTDAVAELVLSGKAYVDDFMCVEVKAEDAKSDVLPMVCNLSAKFEPESLDVGTTISVNAQCYDVNPSADVPVLSYKWQISDDNGLNWKDLTDGASYTITEDDNGKLLRAVAIASNKTSEGFEKTDEEYYKLRYSKYGDIMYFNDADSESAVKTCSIRFPSVSSLSYDETAGIAGSGAAVITRTKATTGSASNDRSERFNQKDYTFKAGFTYFASVWAKKTREDIDTSVGFYLIPGNSKPYSFSGNYVNGTNLSTAFNGKYINNSRGDLSCDWQRFQLGYQINEITLNNEQQADSGGTTAFTITLSGKGGTSGDFPESAPISESNPAKFMFDDLFILELPSDNLLYDVLPRVSSVKVDGSNNGIGSTFTVSGECYDVNPYSKPSLSYKWMSSSDKNEWKAVSDNASYTAGVSDADKYIKAIVTATSVDSFGVAKSHSAESEPIYIEAPSKDSAVSVEYSELKINGSATEEFAPGDADVTLKLKNNYIDTASITTVLAVYTKTGDVKTLSGFKTQTVSVDPGKSGDINLKLSIPENSEVRLMAYFSDDLRPIIIPEIKVRENIVLLGTESENGVTVYEINKFNPVE